MTGPSPDDRGGSGGWDGTAPVGAGSAVQSRVARRRRATGPVEGRTAAVVAAAVVLVGVGIVSLAVPPPTPAPATPAGDGVLVAPADARLSSLFCTSGAGVDAGAGATGAVVLTNTTRSAVHGVMTAYAASGGTGLQRDVTVPALGTVDVVPATGLPAGASAATFSFAGGGVTGTMVISGPTGWSTAPCASAVSPQWEFAGGSTNNGSLDLSLYNPTAAPAVVDASFLTTGGAVLEPQAYEGITVGPHQLVVASLDAHVQGQADVTTLVQAVSGAVVATELDRIATPGGGGLALVAGTPSPATTWRFAQSTAVQGGTVTLVVGNPGTSQLSATVTVGLAGATVTPRVLTVPAHGVATLAVSSVAGWPLGSPYAMTVSAPSPIIVGRTVAAPPAAAAPQSGVARGTTLPSTSWLVVGPGSPGSPLVANAGIHSLAVADVGTGPVSVTVVRLAGGRPVAMARIAAGGLVVFGSAAVGGLHPLLVEATGPVVVEANDGPAGAPGIVSTAGFPLTYRSDPGASA
jgi:hypothetical protein